MALRMKWGSTLSLLALMNRQNPRYCSVLDRTRARNVQDQTTVMEVTADFQAIRPVASLCT